MNKQELIEKYKSALNKVHKVYGDYYKTEAYEEVLKDLKRLDEHENGHADEAPRYVKNILARLRELPLHDREVWLKTIMGEFEQDFSRAKWREGYEQGKVEGLIGREKVTIPQRIDEFITEQKKLSHTLSYSIDACMSDGVAEWYWDNSELFARAWMDGYEIEKEKRYIVKVKGAEEGYNYLNCRISLNEYFFSGESEPLDFRVKHTREMLEKADFGWVFDCEGIEVKEVKE